MAGDDDFFGVLTKSLSDEALWVSLRLRTTFVDFPTLVDRAVGFAFLLFADVATTGKGFFVAGADFFIGGPAKSLSESGGLSLLLGLRLTVAFVDFSILVDRAVGFDFLLFVGAASTVFDDSVTFDDDEDLVFGLPFRDVVAAIEDVEDVASEVDLESLVWDDNSLSEFGASFDGDNVSEFTGTDEALGALGLPFLEFFFCSCVSEDNFFSEFDAFFSGDNVAAEVVGLDDFAKDFVFVFCSFCDFETFFNFAGDGEEDLGFRIVDFLELCSDAAAGDLDLDFDANDTLFFDVDLPRAGSTTTDFDRRSGSVDDNVGDLDLDRSGNFNLYSKGFPFLLFLSSPPSN